MGKRVDGSMVLRAIEPSDRAVLYTLINEPDVESGVVGWSGPVSLYSQDAWASSIKPDEFRYLIEVDGQPAGVAQIAPIDLKNRSGNCNIKLLPRSQGKGVGFRAIGMLLNYCFLELDLEIMTATILETNTASRALFEKSGFRLDGVLRSRVFKGGKRVALTHYSLLRAEYDSR